jgi:rhamnosyl/mannosyltransferase
MTRVLHVGKFYPPVPGGMEQVLESLCLATAPYVDNEVVVFNTGRETVREQVHGVPVTRVGLTLSAGSVPISRRLAAEIRRARADVVVLHEPNPFALLLFATVLTPRRLVIWYHSEVVRPRLQYALFYHPLVRTVYRKASRIVVSSPALGEHAAALAPYRDRLAVVPFGIDAARLVTTPAIAAGARELREHARGRPLVAFAGRMVPYKGVDVLLHAVRELDVALVLAGDGPSRPAWSELAARLGLSERVRFLGEVPFETLAALYHACDVFVLPSVTRAEAFGYVQLEAMACGKPVVSTRVPTGVPWVNRHEETGLTVPPGDVDALRGAIDRLVRDPALCQRFGCAGSARVASEFTLERMGRRAAAVLAHAAPAIA